MNIVDIAKDVLKQLEEKKFVAKVGLYYASPTKDLPCQVCAIGALALQVLDNMSSKADPLIEALAPYVHESDLRRIEMWFEGENISEEDCFCDEEYDAYDWVRDHQDGGTRLRLIMENIIEHGEFKPEFLT